MNGLEIGTLTMLRFGFFRLKLVSLILGLLCSLGMSTGLVQQCFASDWVDLLKPFVTNVIVPGASRGMKKFIQHEEKVHPEFSGKIDDSSTTASSLSSTDNAGNNSTEQFFESSSSDPSFSSPEEPISSTAGSSSGSEYWAASHSSSANDPAPPPPPPVSTPN